MKPISHLAAAKRLLGEAGIAMDEGMTDLDGFVEAARKRSWDRKLKVRALA